MGYIVSDIERFEVVKCVKTSGRSFPHGEIKLGDTLKVVSTGNDYFDGKYLIFKINGNRVLAYAHNFEGVYRKTDSGVV